MPRPSLALLLLATPAGAQGLSDYDWLERTAPAAWAALSEAADYCAAETDGGELRISDSAIVVTDLDGDNGLAPSGEPDDMVVDFNWIFCSRAVTLWAGTGGSPVHFVLDRTMSAAWSGFDWDVERLNAWLPAVILLSRHGSVCDGAGADACVQAIVAKDGTFRTMVSPEQWPGFGDN